MMKIAVLLANRANLARSQTVIEALVKHSECQLTIIACSSFVLEKFGRALDLLGSYPNTEIIEITSNVEGETLETQTKSTGLLIMELSSVVNRIKPDALIVVADRYEVIAGAIAASYQNIPVIHIQGGEVSGNIDDKVRNAVSMFSDMHFPCSEPALERLLNMKGRKGDVHNFGCPAMDLVHRHQAKNPYDVLSKYSHVGTAPTQGQNYILVVFHPETEMYQEAQKRAKQFLSTITNQDFGLNLVMLWPNVDAGSDVVAKEIRRLREQRKDIPLAVYKHFSPEDYLDVMNGAQVLVGNSSSFLREGLHLGKPAVIVGSRQLNRDAGTNVIYATDLEADLLKKIRQSQSRIVEKGSMYGNGSAGSQIAREIINYFGKITTCSN